MTPKPRYLFPNQHYSKVRLYPILQIRTRKNNFFQKQPPERSSLRSENMIILAKVTMMIVTMMTIKIVNTR